MNARHTKRIELTGSGSVLLLSLKNFASIPSQAGGHFLNAVRDGAVCCGTGGGREEEKACRGEGISGLGCLGLGLGMLSLRGGRGGGGV